MKGGRPCRVGPGIKGWRAKRLLSAPHLHKLHPIFLPRSQTPYNITYFLPLTCLRNAILSVSNFNAPWRVSGNMRSS